MGYGNSPNSINHDTPQSAAFLQIAAVDNGHIDHKSPEHLQKIRQLLSKAFDPVEIKWRVTATTTHQSKHGAHSFEPAIFLAPAKCIRA